MLLGAGGGEETGPNRMLPNFLIIGAMKAGTTSLYRYASTHPDVYMSTLKEVQFFNRDERFALGTDWYEQHFSGASGERAVGEASPFYTMDPLFPGVADRIADLLPRIRLIYLVREPIARMRSHYAHLRLGGTERRAIGRALLEEPEYLICSRYATQIERYRARFPADQLLVLRSEDLLTDRAEMLRRVFGFLDVDPGFTSPEFDAEHHTTATGRPRAAVRALRRIPGYERVTTAARGMLGERTLERMKYRTLSSDELVIPDEVRARLQEMLDPEMERLAALVPDLGRLDTH